MRIAVVNLKGGTGKTTTAVHLAAGLAPDGRTLLIDADPQASSLSWSQNPDSGLDATVALPVSDIHQRLRQLGEGYRHVVIDTPPGQPPIVRSALLAADTAVIPIPPSLMDLDRLKATLELIAELEPLGPQRVHVLLTRVRAGTRSARDARAALSGLGVPILRSEIPLREAFVTAFGLEPDRDAYRPVLDELLAMGAVA